MLSEKILFGELKAGQVVLVDAEGEGLLGEFTFRGVSKDDHERGPVSVAATAALNAPTGITTSDLPPTGELRAGAE